MRNAVRAGRDGNDVRTIACRSIVRLLFSFFLSLVFSFFFGNRISKDCLNLFRRIGGLQSARNVRIHQYLRQCCQSLKVSIVAAFGSCNHEEEMCRLSVKRVVVNACLTLGKHYGRFVDGFVVSVRNGNAVAHSGRTFFFTFDNVFFICFFVLDDALFKQIADHFIDDFSLCLSLKIHDHQVRS